MRYWNCNREILQKAKVCAHCEAPVMAEPTMEEMQAARALLEQLPPEAAAYGQKPDRRRAEDNYVSSRRTRTTGSGGR
jgi:hypothetical protein